MKNEIFIQMIIPVLGEITILELKGKNIFSAMSNSKGDPSILSKYLIMEVVIVDGVKITEEQINEMNGADVSYLITVINTMLSKMSF